jgi:hypothetical protein
MLDELLRIAPPGAAVRRWHVSPLVDSLAYHWSWLFALLPMLMMGSEREDYLVLFLLVLMLNFAHRHLTLPIVYCDRQVFQAHPLRFTIAPIAMVALFAIEPVLWKSDYRFAFVVIASFSGAWGLWHTIQQKYGILRLYGVKSEVAQDQRPPPWVDRMLVHGWFPIWIVYLGTSHRETVEQGFARASFFIDPIMDALVGIRVWALPLGGAIAAFSIAAFLWYEWRNDRFANRARLFMGMGTVALSASFLVFDPAKVFLSYTFSHAIEYFVFVWAYQRKRFADPASGPSLMKRMLQRPAFFYWGFLLGVGACYLGIRYWGVYFFPEEHKIRIAGISGSRWIYYWGVSQSMVHFYYDGFMWKMRSPATRANL